MLNTVFRFDHDLAEPLGGDEGAHVAYGGAPRVPAAEVEPFSERHGYRPPPGRRIFGALGTALIIPAILLVASITSSESHRQKPAAVPLSVLLVPLDAPKPEPTKDVPRRPVPKPVPVRQVQIVAPTPIVPFPQPPAAMIVASRAPDPQPIAVGPPAAPPTPAAPTIPSQASHGPDRWEGRVLARLERFRHYPPEAQRARQQGTTTIRFKLDRDGHVLSSSIERSSGNAALDQAALETLQRADPLPKIPADRPDMVELIVPIEFSLSR